MHPKKIPHMVFVFGGDFCKEDETQKSHFEITKGLLNSSLFDIRAYELFNAPPFSVLWKFSKTGNDNRFVKQVSVFVFLFIFLGVFLRSILETYIC